MKKLLTTLSVLLIRTQMALAQSVDDLLPRPGDKITDKEITSGELEAVRDLPNIDTPQAFVTGIRTVLQWSMIITLAALLVASAYYLQSRGNEDDISKAKNIILYLIIGMAVIASAYGIIAGISQFDFFN